MAPLGCDNKTYPDFAAYFEAVLGKPFDSWGELERTHHFVAEYKPELFKATLAEATDERKKQQEAAAATTGEVLPAGTNQHTAKEVVQITPPATSRAAKAKVSLRQQRKLDALARRAPEKLKEIEAGTKSTHRACVEAGIVKEPTPLQIVLRLLPRLTAEDLRALAAEVADRRDKNKGVAS